MEASLLVISSRGSLPYLLSKQGSSSETDEGRWALAFPGLNPRSRRLQPTSFQTAKSWQNERLAVQPLAAYTVRQ
jgi:hypothetical protein